MPSKVTDKFNRYIKLVLKGTLNRYIIREDALDWINIQLVDFVKRLVEESTRFMQTATPPRVSLLERDVHAGIQELLPDSMRRLAETYIQGRLTDFFKNTEERNKTKRANLRVSIGRCTLHIRRNLPNHQIRQTIFIVVAALLEYLLCELADNIKTKDESCPVKKEPDMEEDDETESKEEDIIQEVTLDKVQSACASDPELQSVLGVGLLS